MSILFPEKFNNFKNGGEVPSVQMDASRKIEKVRSSLKGWLQAFGLVTLVGVGVAVAKREAIVSAISNSSEAGIRGSEFTLSSLFQTEADRISEAKQKTEDSEKLYMLKTSEKLSRMALYIQQVMGVLEEYDNALEDRADESTLDRAYANLKKSILDGVSTVTEVAVLQQGREDHDSLPFRKVECDAAMEVLRKASTRLHGADAIEVEHSLDISERLDKLNEHAANIPADQAETCRNKLVAAIAVIDDDRETQSNQKIWETGYGESYSQAPRELLPNPAFLESVKTVGGNRTAKLLP